MPRGKIAGVLALVGLLAHGPARAAEEKKAASDPARLGMTEGDLGKIFGAALKSQKIEPAFAPATNFGHRPGQAAGKGAAARSTTKEPVAKANPWEGQKAFIRAVGQGDVAYAEYFLHGGRLYRIRWTLADRFKRPIMAELVALGTKRYGEPVYDQNIVWKLGDPRANLWRTAWERNGKSLEIRMLNPTIGGMAYLTVSDQKAIRAIVAAGGMVAPEPETAGSWWYAPHAKPRLLTPDEKQGLVDAAGSLFGQSGF